MSASMARDARNGWLALLGGGEWQPGCRAIDEALLAASKAKQVVVIPTAAAYEDPAAKVEQAATYFKELGATVDGVMVLRRADAEEERFVKQVDGAKFIYLAGGSPLHLRSVLKGSALWQAVVAAHAGGAALAGSGAGAMVICDPMVDPRGGAYTVGLGLVEGLAVFPAHDTAADHLRDRSIDLKPKIASLAGIDGQTALIRQPDRTWRVAGAGAVHLYTGAAEPTRYEADSVIRTLTM
jgi:cyanophycinase